MSSDTPSDWQILVPVKTLVSAKSRLQALPRSELMRAFALDTVSAALACQAVAGVVVVTAETGLADELAGLGCRVVEDPGGGLNAALRTGVTTVTGPVAALLGDLPCLRPDDLADALAWAAQHGRAHVADAAGTGTALLASVDPLALEPQFGPGSHAAHEQAGFPDVPLALSTLRRDVDTVEDLRAALDLGVGARTREVLG